MSHAFDPDALRDKYREERDKRLRSDANDQYVGVEGEFAPYLADPYAERDFTRDAVEREPDVAIIGAGLSGMMVAARLRESGIDDVCILDRAGDFGGTWYWNRYPGIACDIESYIYLPLLEELDYVPKEKYSGGKEILDHSRAIARKYGLYERALLQTEVSEVRWDEDAARWILSTNHGDRIAARFVVMANGPLNLPKLPGIPGLEDFEGHSFLANRWDYDYTGGDPDGNLTGLAGKRVGIIGTGATAVQCVPHVGEWAEHLYVFQRTPSSIDVRNNRPTDPEWAASLEPGWQQKRMDNFNALVTGGGYEAEDLVNDGWTEIFRILLGMMASGESTDLSPEGLKRAAELADFEKMEQVRARVDASVEDPEVAEALKPYYRQFCKRPCFHDEYLPTFNRPNVTLVDTDGKGVDRITRKGVVVGDTEYELDCLIYATGFEVGTGHTRRWGYDPVGRGRQSLAAKWEKGVSTLHGLLSRCFPNCFILQLPHSAFTPNFPHAFREQAKHISYIVKRVLDGGLATAEPSEEAENAWVARIIELARMNQDFFESCTPGYYNNEGRPGERSGQDSPYGGGPSEYFRILEAWRDDGGLEGLELR